MDDYGKKGTHSIYSGSDYGLDYNFNKDNKEFGVGYNVPAGAFSFPTDPRTANQITAVSQKLNTGAKGIEISGISTQTLESIPKQHFKEINRLKKLVGVDLTFHGPLVEASGWTDQGWSEINRQGAIRQMTNAIERAHETDPDGNIVVTFHSTNGLPDMRRKIMTPDGEKETEIVVFDERAGQARWVRPQKDFLTGGKEPNINEEITHMNEESWRQELSRLAFNTRQGVEGVERPLRELLKGIDSDKKLDEKTFLEIYAQTKKGNTKFLDNLEPEAKKVAQDVIDNINYGDTYIRESYLQLQGSFNKAWDAAEKSKNEEDKKRLESFQREMQKFLEENKFDDPTNLLKLGTKIQEGVNVLNGLSKAPTSLRPMQDFILDKSSETFSEVAFAGFKKFKEHAPVISIENPPAGGGLSRSEDLKDLVESSRKKFAKIAVEKMGLSEDEAKKQAEKLIGVTWDVGHINMLRKYGYSDKHLKKETEKVAPYVKHIHLSDNFGLEHTELPMGMGNVPTKGHLKILKEELKEKYDKIKQVVETGTWFEPFKTTPVRETLRAFGSPIYSMQMAPHWSGSSGKTGGYFAGYGASLPEQHFNMYGAGFSNLPPELGGQFGGRSRVSGNTLE